MRSIYRKKLSLWGKFVAFIIIPVLLIFLVMLFVIIHVSRTIQLESAVQENQELVDMLIGNYDEMYATVVSNINLITTDESLQKLIARSEYGTEDWLNDNRELRSEISDKTILNSSIEAIYLYDSLGRMRTFWHQNYRLGSTVPLYPTFPSEWGAESGKVTSRMDQDYLLFTRRINSITNLKPVGYCLVIFDKTSFDVSFQRALNNRNNYIILLDASGNIITHSVSDDENAYAIMEACNGAEDSTRTEIPVIGDAIIARTRSVVTGWETISVCPVPEIVRSSTLLTRTLFFVSFVSLLLGAVIALFMAHRWFITPLRQIEDILLKVEGGDYTQRVCVYTGDELEELGKSVNHMLARTDTLINQVLKTELLYRESQFSALQAQINPHFLHNALECINWLAEYQRKDDIRKVTLALSRFMQSLMDTPRLVTVQEELECTKSFLTVYDILLENRLQYTIGLNTEENTIVPRLSIQPLVENAVIHGIKPSMHPGHIDINVSDTDSGILISVYNDGVPMTEAITNSINEFADGTGNGEGLGVGLKNVITRMHLMYGHRASLHCSSDPISGTVFDLIVPYDPSENPEGGDVNVQDSDRG